MIHPLATNIVTKSTKKFDRTGSLKTWFSQKVPLKKRFYGRVSKRNLDFVTFNCSLFEMHQLFICSSSTSFSIFSRMFKGVIGRKVEYHIEVICIFDQEPRRSTLQCRTLCQEPNIIVLMCEPVGIVLQADPQSMHKSS